MGGGGSKHIDGKLSALASQVSDLQKEGQRAIDELTKVSSEVIQLTNMVARIQGVQNKIEADVGRISNDINEIKSDISKIQQGLQELHRDHIAEIAALNALSDQLRWSTMVLQIADHVQRIESMYAYLMKLSFGSKTTARWFVRDVLSSTTGAYEALNAINSVLTGEVVVDPKQGSMILEFAKNLTATGAERRRIMLSYFNSLAYVQIKGIILLINAYRAIGENEISAEMMKQIRMNIFKQYLLVFNEKWDFVVVGVNHGYNPPSVMAEDGVSLNGEPVVPDHPHRSPFVGIHVTVMPAFNPYYVQNCEYFDTTKPEGQEALRAFLSDQRAYVGVNIMVIASAGPAGPSCSPALKSEMQHWLGDGFTGFDDTSVFAALCVGGDLRIAIQNAPHQKRAILKTSLLLDPTNPESLKFPARVHDDPPAHHLLSLRGFGLGAPAATKWSDVLVRTGPNDVGMVPYNGANWVSPDIIINGPQPEKDYKTKFESEAGYKNENLCQMATNNVTNFIYIRMKNLGSKAVKATVRLYETPARLLNTPSSFVPIPFKTSGDPGPKQVFFYDNEVVLNPGEVRVTSEPFLWNPKDQAEHTCMFVMVGTEDHPLPDIKKVTASDIVVNIHRNYAQRNISFLPSTGNAIDQTIRFGVDEQAEYQVQLRWYHMASDAHVGFTSAKVEPLIQKEQVTNSSDDVMISLPYTLQDGWESQLVYYAKKTNTPIPADARLQAILQYFELTSGMSRAEFAAFTRDGVRPVRAKVLGMHETRFVPPK